MTDFQVKEKEAALTSAVDRNSQSEESSLKGMFQTETKWGTVDMELAAG